MNRPDVKPPVLWRTWLLLGLALALLVLLGAAIWWFAEPHRIASREVLKQLAIDASIIWGGLCVLTASVWALKQLAISERVRQLAPHQEPLAGAKEVNAPLPPPALRDALLSGYGHFWRRHVRILLVVGETDDIDAVAPGLAASGGWQEGQGTLLLWGGPVQGRWESDWSKYLRELSWRRPLDGIVWALSSEQADKPGALDLGVRQLQTLARRLRWQAPLYLWQLCASRWEQSGRGNSAVGCLLPPGASAQLIETQLRQLLVPLREQGLRQMSEASVWDFLPRLSRDLDKSGIDRWCRVLVPLLPAFTRGAQLRGLLFSLAQKPASKGPARNTWWPTPAWDAIVEDRRARGHRFGWTWVRGAQMAALGFAGLCAVALLLSFASNRSQIASVDAALATVNSSGNLDTQLTALHQLTRTMTQLEQRQENGVPWYQRFGLSQNDALLAALWPRFTEANNRLMRDEAARSLEQRLLALAHPPPGSPQLSTGAASARDQLKAYLMLAQPEKAIPEFLAKELEAATVARAGAEPVRWQRLAPDLWAFYARHLQAHPEWRIAPDSQVVAQARQVLLAQLDQPMVEQALYQRLLDEAGNQYVALGLTGLVGESDATKLFAASANVPGALTRQAWDGYLREAIRKITEARVEELDWVLSDPQHPLAPDVQPEALKARLTSRYFSDYSQAWLGFLNSIRWRKASSQTEAIEQLSLLADARRSPLLALMQALAYQGRAGGQGEQGSIKGSNPVAGASAPADFSPMEHVFGPLLALQGKRVTADSGQASLQAYLARVIQVRTRLQQVENAGDPRAMAQVLAQATFQGLTLDRQDYGQVVAQSLGKPLAAFAQNLFVLPLDQAWSGVMQSSAGDLNRRWQQAIVADWQRAFAGRYPFVAAGADAPLPLLGQMIRPGGHIDRFIADELGGVLRKQGKRWVPVAGNSQGVRVSPAFLGAINRLGELADTLYSDGAMRMSFQLKAKPVRDLVETQLIIDGERLEYFNQMESWRAFTWPSPNDHPGVSLTWSSIKAGARLYGDYPGRWALIRLLEQARVTPLADNGSIYQVVLTASDGIPLTWEMRTQSGPGPLVLLKLRGFNLPLEVLQGERVRALTGERRQRR
ncbi:ImcF-related family protein [Pseudomonas nitroreducens]|uniref:ImcF-related family protein n=1 Tax=Pseudomonas nitroreducens TaxID=46680 RepID=UPI002D7FF518|nr:ImcF-related family protein [Pseudomonas nitroreducens]